ncbi:MAG: DUF3500 domain-containing protein [Thermomicrobiales bacterium]
MTSDGENSVVFQPQPLSKCHTRPRTTRRSVLGGVSVLGAMTALGMLAPRPSFAQGAPDGTPPSEGGPGGGGPGGGGQGGPGGVSSVDDLSPFVGITTDGTALEGLFPIGATGASTTAIVDAAEAFLATLDSDQLADTHLEVDSEIIRVWTNVDGTNRQGTGFRAMTDSQKSAAFALLESSLSAYGYESTTNIIKLNHTQGELTNDFDRFDEDLYFFTIYGDPSTTEPWAWRIEGHHLIICYFLLGDQLVMAPCFFGSEPVIAPEGTEYAGLSVLQDEQDKGLAFVNALSADQQSAAILSANKAGEDMQAGAGQDNAVIAYAGVSGADLDEAQQSQLLALIEQWISRLPDDQASVKMAEVQDHIADTWFAWIGETDDDAVFYYRIQSPVVLIEFDHQQPGPLGQESDYYQGATGPQRMHIHSVMRTPNGGDYGRDLLAEHYATSAHHNGRFGAGGVSSTDGLAVAGGAAAVLAAVSAGRKLPLPLRYQFGHPVCSDPMGAAAPLLYDEDGHVAWDRMWEDFCDLAMAGGPPHRGSMLEAPSRDAVLMDLGGQARVLAQLSRGLTMVTGWPSGADIQFGWVNLTCPDEATAIWLEQAILAENIRVERSETILHLPAGPQFTVAGEIKNVVTAVAKSHHYWTEHLLGDVQ